MRILYNTELLKKVLKKKEKTLTTREYYSTVFGILFIIQGSAIITLYTPPFTGEYDVLLLLSGMFLIIVGALMEVHTQTNVKKSIQKLEEKIKELEKNSDKNLN